MTSSPTPLPMLNLEGNDVIPTTSTRALTLPIRNVPSRSAPSHTASMTIQEVVEAATRREFIAMMAAAGLLVACGADDADDSAAGGETRRIEHALGVADVPVRPARVAALNVTAADPVLTLGVPTVLVPDLLPAVLVPLAEGIERTSFEVNVEQIARLEPDLIVSASFEGELFEGIPIEQLERIAPTVAWEFTSDYAWRDYYRFYADVLGRAADAEERLTVLDQRIAQVAAAVGDPTSLAVSVVRVYDDGSLVNFRTDRSFAGSILDPVGFARPDVAADVSDISLENIDIVDADAIFVFGAEAEASPEVERLMDNPLFQSLDAAQNGRAFAVGAHWFGFGVLAAEEILADIERTLGS